MRAAARRAIDDTPEVLGRSVDKHRTLTATDSLLFERREASDGRRNDDPSTSPGRSTGSHGDRGGEPRAAGAGGLGQKGEPPEDRLAGKRLPKPPRRPQSGPGQESCSSKAGRKAAPAAKGRLRQGKKRQKDRRKTTPRPRKGHEKRAMRDKRLTNRVESFNKPRIRVVFDDAGPRKQMRKGVVFALRNRPR
jgi:hypothetical protein